jgi:hypothetical protein
MVQSVVLVHYSTLGEPHPILRENTHMPQHAPKTSPKVVKLKRRPYVVTMEVEFTVRPAVAERFIREMEQYRKAVWPDKYGIDGDLVKALEFMLAELGYQHNGVALTSVKPGYRKDASLFVA